MSDHDPSMKSIRDVSLRFLSYRDRSVCEMRKHLKGKGYDEAEIDREIDSLIQMAMLDDIRLGVFHLRGGMERMRGGHRLRRELAQKGLSAHHIEDAIYRWEQEEGKDFAQEERRLAYRAASQFMAGKEADQKILARLGRKLQTLGYGSDIIYEIIGRYRNGEAGRTT